VGKLVSKVPIIYRGSPSAYFIVGKNEEVAKTPILHIENIDLKIKSCISDSNSFINVLMLS
jgi:hypothetical protein